MESLVVPFLKALILVPVTLLPIINPLSTAPVFIAAVGANRSIAKRLARQVAINCRFVVVISILLGTYVWRSSASRCPWCASVAACWWPPRPGACSTAPRTTTCMPPRRKKRRLSDAEIVRRSFFPITFPLTTGPGTIAASIALGAQIPTTPVLFWRMRSCGRGPALVSWSSTSSSELRHVLERLGAIGMLVMMRLMAFILLCIGIQIMWNGWAD